MSSLRTHIHCHEQNVGRNMNINSAYVEVSNGKEEHAIGNWKTLDPLYKAVENVSKLCFVVYWKVESWSHVGSPTSRSSGQPGSFTE